MGFVTDHLKWVDPKWVITGLVIGVAAGAVANFRVGSNAEAISKIRTDQMQAVTEIHGIELRTVRLETKLEVIDENTRSILRHVEALSKQ